MKFLIAPNAFKGTIPADEAAEIIGAIIREQIPNSEIVLQPIADGGDGTCALLIDSLQLKNYLSWVWVCDRCRVQTVLVVRAYSSLQQFTFGTTGFGYSVPNRIAKVPNQLR